MRWLKRLVIVFIILLIIYLLGPAPVAPKYELAMPAVPSITGLDKYVAANEALHKLKPGNEARIVWANDSTRQKTPFAIVYLHGFSASEEEGDPVHRDIAKQFGCNLYLSRLAEHGIDTTDQLVNLTVDNYWASAKQALAIGKQLGDKVILMGTSTGGTLALQLAAAYPGDVAALILYSPNIAINDPNAWVLNNHWGLQVARMIKGSPYIEAADDRPAYKQFWNKTYRIEAAVALQEMLETTMNKETFKRVRQPVLLLYYYQDEQHQDPVVKVSAMQEMFSELGTTDSIKRKIALPKTGNHVITSPIKSGDIASVEAETRRFLEEIVHLPPAK